MKSRAMFLILMIPGLVSYASLGISAEDEEFDYQEGGEKGPSRWGDLKEEWRTCKTGQTQSPVDIRSGQVKVVGTNIIQMNYVPGSAVLKNRGYDITVQWELGKAGSMRVNGETYHLQQCHWHSPSEHAIDNKRHELELHMVHMSSDNKVAVVGLLYQTGSPNDLIAKLTDQIRSLIDRKEEISIGEVNPGDIKFDGNKYYHYTGSLTTPPCTEGVTWIVNEQLSTASSDQISLLREAVFHYAENNVRPLQPLNGREIKLHTPTA